jgi:hypothetical protein
VFDDIIDRQASPGEAARTAAVIASDFRFAYFGSAAFVVRLLRFDQKFADGVPVSRRKNVEHPQRQTRIASRILRPSREAGRRDRGVVRRWQDG